MVENFAHLGLDVTLIEKLSQVMPPLDPEMACLVERYLVKHGVRLEEAELCYAPPFGSAKDPVNFAGMAAGNLLRADMPIARWNGIGQALLLDVRYPRELEVESVPGAVNIPLPQLRARLGELPRDREILVICRSGGRAYYATRILLQNGFSARNISGGMLSRSHRAS